ncbi:MAG: MFS transporter, partial [Hyphomicrobiales bacterium]|nr:MFS transporter [Hyphomicrobiales bacterium]
IWLNGVVSDRQRGRVLSLAMILYTAAQFVGPLTVSLTGVVGLLPFVIVMTPLALAIVIALTIRSTGTAEPEPGIAGPVGLRTAFSLASAIIVITFLVGVTTTAALSLLPLFGLLNGLTDRGAADLVVIFSLGEALFVGLFGFLADRFDRRWLLRICAIPTALVAIALPLTMNDPALLNPMLFLAGGTLGGIYTLCLILIGQDFRGRQLAAVSTVFAMSYSAGSVVGSTPIGYLIDAFGSAALPMAIAVALGLLAFAILRTAGSERAAQTSILDQSIPVDIEHAEVGDLQMRNDRQSKERDLQEWFLQRAAKTARRLPQRNQAGTDRLERPQAHKAGKRKGEVRKDLTA